MKKALLTLLLASASCRSTSSFYCEKLQECGVLTTSLQTCEALADDMFARKPTACEDEVQNCTALQECRQYLVCATPSCR